MSRLIQLVIEERKVTIVLSLIILCFGLYTYYLIPKQENPDTSSPAAQIMTVYPGATATDVEKLVTKPIEDVVASLEGIDYIKSYSNDNVSIVVVMLTYDVVYEDQWDKLRNGIEILETDLPTGVMRPEIKTDMTEAADVILTLTGQGYNNEQLAVFAEKYKDALDNVSGIKKIEIEGEIEKKLVVEVQNEKLLQYNVSIKDIFELIGAQNVEIPAGSIKTDSGKINLTTPDGLTSKSSVEELIIFSVPNKGSMVRLKDVAQVYYEEVEESVKFRDHGEPAVMLAVYFKDNENAVLVGKEVKAVIDVFQRSLPENIEVDELLFLPKDVEEAIGRFILNLFQGMVLVILVVLFGMGRRNAFIVSFTIPLSIAVTLIMMFMMKLEVQQVSIAALIIALGILVDNSIVIGDAIQVKINEGLAPDIAAFEGAREQAVPVLSSTLTTIVAFAPLMVLPGEAGEFAKTLPLVVMIALTASYISAMLVTPALASVFFVVNVDKKDRLSSIKSIYLTLIKSNLQRPKWALSVVLIIFSISLLGISLIEVKMFPYVDKDIVYFNIVNERSGDIETTSRLISQVEKMLLEEEEILSVSSSVGGGLPRFYMTVDVMSPSDDKGQILSHFDLNRTDRFTTREAFAFYLQERFDHDLIGGNCTVNLLEINIPGPTIDVQLSGANIGDVNRVAEKTYEKLIQIPGTLNVQSDKTTYTYKYHLDVDEELASVLGLTKYDIQYQINLSLNGGIASVIRVEGNTYDIEVISNIETIEDIENLGIKSPYTGEKILVKQFSEVTLMRQQSTLKRYDRDSMVSVSAKVRPEVGQSKVQREIESFLENEVDLNGVSVNYGGDNETITRYLTGLVSAGMVALIAVYIILLIQFNSLKQPLIILASIPLSFIGIIVALLITKTHFTFTVGLGIASLFGIVVNNAILLIEYINRFRKKGLPLKASCMNSVKQRIRPILLSSITTIFGLMPLVMSKSSFFTPMAIALVGGLLFSTLLTITVVPTIYYCMEGSCKDR